MKLKINTFTVKRISGFSFEYLDPITNKIIKIKGIPKKNKNNEPMSKKENKTKIVISGENISEYINVFNVNTKSLVLKVYIPNANKSEKIKKGKKYITNIPKFPFKL